jgi:hypothetical protein
MHFSVGRPTGLLVNFREAALFAARSSSANCLLRPSPFLDSAPRKARQVVDFCFPRLVGWHFRTLIGLRMLVFILSLPPPLLGIFYFLR